MKPDHQRPGRLHVSFQYPPTGEYRGALDAASVGWQAISLDFERFFTFLALSAGQTRGHTVSASNGEGR